jgi:hypothetical protein
MQHHDMQHQRGVIRFDFVLGAEVERNRVFPGFERGVELAYRLEELAVGLLRRFGRIQLSVDLRFDARERAHEAEEVDLPLPVRKRDVTNAICRVFLW